VEETKARSEGYRREMDKEAWGCKNHVKVGVCHKLIRVPGTSRWEGGFCGAQVSGGPRRT